MATAARDITTLDTARAAQERTRSAEVDLAAAVVDWAVAHPPLDEADAALVQITQSVASGVELPLNGEGVPLVSAVGVAELGRWCTPTDTGVTSSASGGVKITIRPVLDLAEQIHHNAYETPTRLREQIIARDHTCVYPRCTRPARSGDIDHIIPFDHDHPHLGGQTQTSNLAALCRHHHRLKTTGHLTYEMTRPGVFVWTMRDSRQYRRDHTGTLRLLPDLPDEPEPDPPRPTLRL